MFRKSRSSKADSLVPEDGLPSAPKEQNPEPSSYAEPTDTPAAPPDASADVTADAVPTAAPATAPTAAPTAAPAADAPVYAAPAASAVKFDVPDEEPRNKWVAKPADLSRGMTTVFKSTKADYDDTQHKTFARWWNAQVPRVEGIDIPVIEDLPTGLADGVAPLVLLNSLTASNLKVNPAPKLIAQRIENYNIFFAKLKELGVKMVNISAEDMTSGSNLTLTLGMTWHMICHFGGITEQSSAELLDWVKTNASKVGAWRDGNGFIESLADGKALCGVMMTYDKTSVPKETLSADKATALEAAFAAGESFGAPRLLDAADVASGNVDTRSLSTYLVMLQSALLEHNDNRGGIHSRTGAEIAKEAEKEVAWANEKAASFQTKMSEVSGLSPSDPTGVAKAEEMWAELEKYAKNELKDHNSAVEALRARVDTLVAQMKAAESASSFVHGPRRRARLTHHHNAAANESSNSVPANSAAEMSHLLDHVPPAFSELSKVEAALREALDSVLTTRRTDAMLAEVEATRDEFIAKIKDWVKKLQDAQYDPETATLPQTQSVAELMEQWSADAKVMKAEKAEAEKKLETVRSRREKEGREAPPSWEELCGAILTAEAEVEAAASELRRLLARGVAKQVTDLDKLTATWSRLAPALADTLPSDSTLISPVPAVPWFVKCFAPK